jgi:hypothetical protein
VVKESGRSEKRVTFTINNRKESTGKENNPKQNHPRTPKHRPTSSLLKENLRQKITPTTLKKRPESGKSLKEFKKSYESQYSFRALQKQKTKVLAKPKSEEERLAEILVQVNEC